MANSPVKHPPDWGGPYAMAAFFCEEVVIEAGAPTFRRVFDRMVTDGEVAATQARMVIALRAGRARGHVTLRVLKEDPSGLVSPILEQKRRFELEDTFTHWEIPVRLEFTEFGVYWFWVVVNDKLLTKLSIRAEQRQTTVWTPVRPDSPETHDPAS